MNELYDLIIIGSGSAGMTAGIYAGRSKLKTLLIERDEPGGQIRITSEVENYPGIPRISGEELSQTMRRQAENFGVKFLRTVVESVDFTQDIKKIRTVEGEYEALAVIVATGSVPRKLGFIGEEEFKGRGIGYCATCDGEFFSGMDVFVIGAGFAAAEEAIFLTRYARKVTVIARGAQFSCSKTIAEKVLAHPKIEVKFNTEILEVGGDTVPRYATFIDKKTGESWRYDVPESNTTFGLFVFVGYIPQSAEYAQQLRLDEKGYILTDADMSTNVDGVYAAGDIRPKALRQLVTAVSDGAIAATCAEKYLAQKKERLGLSDEEQEVSVLRSETFFDEELKEQLVPILERFEKRISLLTFLDETSEFNEELKSFLSEFASLSDKVQIQYLNKGENPEKEKEVHVTLFPAFAILDSDGSYTGVQFHGIPGGHEINSFILALYNAAGPGQTIGAETLEKIQTVKKKVNLKIGVSLSCTLCPDVVALSQLMALKNPLIEAEMIDVSRFPDFKNQYAIMSVPAIVINDDKLSFGKKTLDDLLALMEG
ncbi:FAD-dependent oxidoreductase [Clostridium aminobutyricum]|uniref:FAD-dependent oxidoreductase n=1 Tax=Clostridium aminobutyricum TaxID=33953 RepID=A0A939D9N3_CLOAM|nr:FAD-dependent oxidoreductase [Clostridium aminobutyricum]MBN7773776.1 FAD-dependent oxidoreductase [Clostridium aminobutyricum]